MFTIYIPSLITIWTIHKVNNETPKGARSYENVPYTIEYNLDDLESVLCVYFVYEELKFSGWEADDCKNAAVVHHVLCDDGVNGIMDTEAFPKLTFYDKKVVWTEAKKYCEYTNSTLIDLYSELYVVSLFEDSLKLNLTSLTSFWSESPTSSVVFDESMCEFGVGELISHEFGIELQILLSDEFKFKETSTDCTNPIHAIMCKKQTVTIGEYKPLNEPGSTELRIQDNDNTDPMVTDQQASTLGKTAPTTKPTSTVGNNAEGRILTIIMGLICTVSCVILIYKAAPILHQVKHMESSLADEKITRKDVEEQIYDAFTIEMSDDGIRMLTEGVITLNIPPTCHKDII
ncbi:unnamed protein product [Mytilus coruscus]|uniref:C-type lectin domain-containing protein n=1 Tax=Mytilus coruscus TaxID=42192 RepID=A0A6J8ELF7_MYTCO|nr:unnamed protein product [Mytilus coruscus]